MLQVIEGFLPPFLTLGGALDPFAPCSSNYVNTICISVRDVRKRPASPSRSKRPSASLTLALAAHAGRMLGGVGRNKCPLDVLYGTNQQAA